MIGVKFTKDMRPYGRGDTAMLPDDVARRIIDEGSAERYAFPVNPHACGAGEATSVVSEPARPTITLPRKDDRRQAYQTKDMRR